MEEKNVRASESGELKTLEVASPEIPMTKGAMRYLVELGKQTKDFEVVEIGGRIFTNTGTDGTLEEITPFETECPSRFSLRHMAACSVARVWQNALHIRRGTNSGSR